MTTKEFLKLYRKNYSKKNVASDGMLCFPAEERVLSDGRIGCFLANLTTVCKKHNIPLVLNFGWTNLNKRTIYGRTYGGILIVLSDATIFAYDSERNYSSYTSPYSSEYRYKILDHSEVEEKVGNMLQTIMNEIKRRTWEYQEQVLETSSLLEKVNQIFGNRG